MARALVVISEFILLLFAAFVVCAGNGYSQTLSPDAGQQVVAPSAASPATGAAQTSVLIYLKSVTVKKYGWLAQQVGYRNTTVALLIYDPRMDWWTRPALLYEDTPISSPDAVGGADCAVMKGIGGSSNVDVTLALTCHADVAFKTLPKADCIKGTITATLTASANFFDGRWTNVVTVIEKPVAFKIDTCDPSRRIRPIGAETRNIPIFFEAYTRGRTRWLSRTQWPGKPERADVRVVLYARDAQLDITGYRYDDASSKNPQK